MRRVESPGRSRRRSGGRRQSSSFSLKTSPSTFLSSPPPEDARRRVGSHVPRHVDHVWSVGGAYDASPASIIMSSSPSALDTVSYNKLYAKTRSAVGFVGINLTNFCTPDSGLTDTYSTAADGRSCSVRVVRLGAPAELRPVIPPQT